MPFNVKRTAQFIDKEILRGADGLTDIKSYVVDSTRVAVNPPGSGRYILEAGTVMAKIPASNKIQPITYPGGGSSGGAYVAGDIVGVLASTTEFYIGDGVAAGEVNVEPVAVFHHGAHFNVNKLVGYAGNEAIVKAALPTCIFS